MTKYILILRTDITKDFSDLSPQDMQEIIEGYGAWGAMMESEGRLQLGRKLADEGGCVMQPQASGDVQIKDGPYTETKEVVGGVYLIEADSYEHAAKLCKDHPNFRFGSIEIRELDFMGQPEE